MYSHIHVPFCQAASWVENDRTVLIDASTAFRVDDDWTYGFPGERNQCMLSISKLQQYMFS